MKMLRIIKKGTFSGVHDGCLGEINNHRHIKVKRNKGKLDKLVKINDGTISGRIDS